MPIDTAVHGRTLIITINRPEARNAVDGDVARGIEAAVNRLEAEDDLWVGILTGAGPVFCAGADLRLFGEGRDREMFTERGNFGGLVRLPRTKPLIAAVDGPALAGGFELVMACDLIVASRSARFGLPEVKRSLVAAAGGLPRLPRLLPPQVAAHILLSGDPIEAERAYSLGMIAELTEPGQALDAALTMAEKLNANAPLAVRRTMAILREAPDLSFEETWKLGRAAIRDLAKTEDYREGPRAFVEKRAPVWQGR